MAEREWVERKSDKAMADLTESIDRWHAGQQEQVDKLSKILMGNGNVGLCETVRQLANGAKALWCVVGAVGLAIVGGVIAIILK